MLVSGSVQWVSQPSWVTSTCGPEGLQQRRDNRFERLQPQPVRRERRQRDVDRGAGRRPRTDLLDEAGAGKDRPAVLVERDGQHPGLVVEDLLHAVAVVGVDVDVGNPLHPVVQHPGDGHRRVVVDAEAARPARAWRGEARRPG